METTIAAKILQRLKRPELLSLLSEQISGSDLNSLLLEVFNQRASALTPPALLKLYERNRFVKPADLPVVVLRRMELDILEIFQTHLFTPIELSPVSVLGSCSVVAPADQKKILTALRGTEVLADATNALALHVSHLKKSGRWVASPSETQLRFGAIQRHLRTQSIQAKGFTPHFKIGCLVSCGTDSGSYGFEKSAVTEHVRVMTTLFRDYYKTEDVSFRLLCRSGYAKSDELANHVRDFALRHNPQAKITVVENPETKTNYYQGIQFKVDIVVNGKTYEIGDGGFVDWTQKLLQNKKERMFSTGFGFEFMYRILNGGM